MFPLLCLILEFIGILSFPQKYFNTCYFPFNVIIFCKSELQHLEKTKSSKATAMKWTKRILNYLWKPKLEYQREFSLHFFSLKMPRIYVEFQCWNCRIKWSCQNLVLFMCSILTRTSWSVEWSIFLSSLLFVRCLEMYFVEAFLFCSAALYGSFVAIC